MVKAKQILLFLIFVLLFACHDDDSPTICELSAVSIKYSETNIVDQTYEFGNGKLLTITGGPAGTTKFNYDQRGLVTSMELDNFTKEISYGNDKKPTMVKNKQGSATIGTYGCIWGQNSLRMIYTPEGLTYPSFIQDFELVNENITKKFVTLFNLSGQVSETQETTYSVYDEKRNPYLVSKKAWESYPVPISKNNYNSLIYRVTPYSNGVAQPTQTYTFTFSYKFNVSNNVSERTTLVSPGSTPRVETFTYSNCN